MEDIVEVGLDEYVYYTRGCFVPSSAPTVFIVEDDEEDTPMLGGSEDPNPTLLDSSQVE